jgi:transposase
MLVYDVYAGIDVGKFGHYAVAILTSDQSVVLSKGLDQDESAIRAVVDELKSYGKALVAIDQRGRLGHLIMAVCAEQGIDVGFLAPHDFKVFSKALSGDVKSDAKDARVIAEIAMRMTDVLHEVDTEDELAGLRALVRYRKALVKDNTKEKNRIREFLSQACPAFEAIFGMHDLNSTIYLRILSEYGGPQGLRRAGRERLIDSIDKMPYFKTRSVELADKVFQAIDRQTVKLPGGEVAESVVKLIACSIIYRKMEIMDLDERIEHLFKSFEQSAIILSIPGVGCTLGAIMLAEIGDISAFANAGQLAAYAGVAPSKRQSGKTLNHAIRRVSFNRLLKDALFSSAQISIRCDEWSKWYYDKKRAEGKKHSQAVLALARHRIDFLYAMLSTGSFYEPKTTTL